MNHVSTFQPANVVLLNFHFSGALISERLQLDEVKRTPEEMARKELERAKNANPGLKRQKKDAGVPALGRYGEANLNLTDFVRELLDNGFELIEAYKQRTFKTEWKDGKPVVSGEHAGTVARFVFSRIADRKLALPKDVLEQKLDGLRKGLEGFIAPCVHVYHNYGDDGLSRTTDTVNVGTLSTQDERNEVPLGELHYREGTFSVLRRDPDSEPLTHQNFRRTGSDPLTHRLDLKR